MKQQGHRLSCLCSTARPAPVAPAASACTPDEFNTNLLVVSICFPELFAEFKKHYQIRIPDNALILTFKTWNSEMTSSLSQLVSKSQVHALQAETQSGRWISEIICCVSVQALVQSLNLWDRLTEVNLRQGWLISSFGAALWVGSSTLQLQVVLHSSSLSCIPTFWIEEEV